MRLSHHHACARASDAARAASTGFLALIVLGVLLASDAPPIQGREILGEIDSAEALVSMESPGDCNADAAINAGDISAVALRIFGQSFAANATCDANGDGPVDAADVSCTVLKIFSGPHVCGVSDPAAVAPPIDPTVPTDIAESTAFLYSGGNPIQRGVAQDVIEPRRVAVLRGRVLDKAGEPTPGVRIDVLDHPELGHTFTRLDGRFDLAVNGGGPVTLRYAKDGLLPAQRTEVAPWRDFVAIDDVVMIPLDPVATEVDLTSSAPIQVARGGSVVDDDGERQARVMFKAGTEATVQHTDGTTSTLTSLTVRATEYTVGDNGPETMPAALPPQSGYTYAVELSVDEAPPATGDHVVFSQPVPFYVENFLDFPVGMAVPAGYYDRAKAQWIPSDNGRVIAIVGETGGLADVDVDGDGLAEDAGELDALGIDGAEREKLAELYAVGAELWRVGVGHFTPWDCNWPYGPPVGAVAPTDAPEWNGPMDDPCKQPGSIVECENQVLGESVAVSGTPFTLQYRSDRVPGWVAERAVRIPITGNTVPNGLKRADIVIAVAGQEARVSVSANANQSHHFTWDGKDGFGRTAIGSQEMRVRVGYVYEGIYYEPTEFGRAFGAFSGVPITGAPARQEVTLWGEWSSTIMSSMDQQIGKWGLSAHQEYLGDINFLRSGNGTRRGGAEREEMSFVETVAGGLGDGGPATEADIKSPRGVAIGPDGSIYLTDENRRIRRVAPDGIISTVAGDGTNGSGGDGGPATRSQVGAHDIAIGPDGSVYINNSSNGSRVRRVTSDGTILNFAGNGNTGYSGDGGPATQASLIANSIEIGADGSLYIAGGYRVRRVMPSGIITTVAGNGIAGFSGDGGLAIDAQIGSTEGVAVGADGSVYISEQSNRRVRRVAPDGVITTVAGNGTSGFSGDGGLATQAALGNPLGIAVDTDGSLYIVAGRVRRVAPDGIITTVAGTGSAGVGGDGIPATQSALWSPSDVAVGSDGSFYIADTGTHRVRRVTSDGLINTVAGAGWGNSGSSGDNGLATHARLHAYGGAVGPNGSIYIADDSFRVRRVTTDGTITTVAGTGVFGHSGDGGEATQAELRYPSDIAFAPDGSYYILEGKSCCPPNWVRRVTPDGLITTVAGNGTLGYSGDGGPASQASFHDATSITVGPDGSVYIADSGNLRVRRIAPDGIITTIAGTGVAGFSGDSGPAVQAQLRNVNGVAVGPDGSIFIADGNNYRVRRVTPDGTINTVAGNGQSGNSGDGGPATLARITVVSIAVDLDGSLYIAGDETLRRVTPDGTITTLASGQENQCTIEGQSPRQVGFNPISLWTGPDGSVYLAVYGTTGGFATCTRGPRVLRIRPQTGLRFGEEIVPSDDASEIYVFKDRRHVRTLNAHTNAVLYTFSYDPAGRLITITDGDSNVTTIERAADGSPTAIVGPYGHRTTLGLDANGYLDSITNPAGETTSFTYTADGLLTSMTDPRGNIAEYTYDSQGYLIRADDRADGFQTLARTELPVGYEVLHTTALGRTTRYRVERLATGDLKRTIIAPNNKVTTILVGSDGRTTTTDPDGTVTTETYGPDPRFGMDARLSEEVTVNTPGSPLLTTGNARGVSLANPIDPLDLSTLVDYGTVNGRSARAKFTASSRTWESVSAANRSSIMQVDALGRPTEIRVPALTPSYLAYDSRGRLTSVAQGTGNAARTSTFAYNTQGVPEILTDSLGRSTTYGHDAIGRPTLQTLPGARTIAFAYDPNGNLTSLTPPGRPAHSFAYTPHDLLATYTPPAVPGTGPTHYTYNSDRDLTRIDRADGRSVNLAYDSAGRPSALTIQRGSIGYTYHATTGNLTSIAAPGGIATQHTYDGFLPTGVTWTGPVAGTVSYAYDNDLRVASITAPNSSAIAYQYDADSLLTQAGALTLTRDSQSGLLTGSALAVITDTRTYNGFAEPVGYTATFSGSLLYDAVYVRDKLGRITTLTETIGATTDAYAYGYDTAGRLASVEKNGASVAGYTYDLNGNRLTATTPGGTTTGSYDAQDRLTAYGPTTYAYTADGELASKTISGQTTTYEYDELGNLMTVGLPGGTQIGYVVDGMNRRIGKKVNGTLVQGFLYDGQLRPVVEKDAAGTVVSRFVYATRVNVPDTMIRAGTTYRILTDHLGSPRLVVNAATGAVAQRMDYDAWGKILTDTNPGFQPFGFAGGLYDKDTGLVRFGARDYDAEVGRWVAKDPAGFGGGDTNLYTYVLGDPLNLVDVLGRAPDSANVAAGAVAVVGATAATAAALIAGTAVLPALAAGVSLGLGAWGLYRTGLWAIDQFAALHNASASGDDSLRRQAARNALRGASCEVLDMIFDHSGENELRKTWRKLKLPIRATPEGFDSLRRWRRQVREAERLEGILLP